MSSINTGDFDFVTEAQSEFETELQNIGFVKPSGPSFATRGWIHPDLKLGFEVVGASLLDGMADRDRVRLIDFAEDGQIAVICVEDLIADRMGQFSSGTAQDMLGQARALYALHPDADPDYLEKRIQEETGGSYGLKDVQFQH